MKGIILAGGTGSRLDPLTKVTNKHLLPVGDKPMIFYPIEQLLDTEITEILIITGTEHMGAFVELLGSGKEFGCSFTYKVQDEAGGIAQALLLAEEFAGGEEIAVILGDNIFDKPVLNYGIGEFQDLGGAFVFLKEVTDPQRFGIVEIVNHKIVSIEEKPTNPRSNYAVTGLYLYDEQVFDFIKTLKPSARGELEISDINKIYLEEDCLDYMILNCEWTDAGTFESLHKANKLIRGEQC